MIIFCVDDTRKYVSPYKDTRMYAAMLFTSFQNLFYIFKFSNCIKRKEKKKKLYKNINTLNSPVGIWQHQIFILR